MYLVVRRRNPTLPTLLTQHLHMLSSAMHDEVPRTTILLAWRDAPTITSTLANGSSTEHIQRISYMLGMETIFPRMEMALAESTRKYKYGLRPITLAEALRKLWSKRVLRKRRAVWRKHDILNVSQHGYSAHRGTYTTMVQHLNLLEDAIESGLPIHSIT